MKVNIGPIRDTRGGVTPFEGEQAVDSIKEIAELDLVFSEPVKVKGKVTNTGEGFLVEAELSFEYRVGCGRCLEKFNERRTIAIKEEFLPGFSATADDTVFGFTGDLIDLEKCLNEQVLLALPMKFLCNPECRGFCPGCGVNLNKEDCHCPKERINPDFEKLGSLFFKKEVD